MPISKSDRAGKYSLKLRQGIQVKEARLKPLQILQKRSGVWGISNLVPRAFPFFVGAVGKKGKSPGNEVGVFRDEQLKWYLFLLCFKNRKVSSINNKHN